MKFAKTKSLTSLLIIFVLCTMCVSAEDISAEINVELETGDPVNAGVLPGSFLWNFDLFFDNIQDVFSEKARVRHEVERISEVEELVSEKEGVGLDKAMKRIRNKNREQVREKAQNKIGDELVIDEILLDNFKEYLNDEMGGTEEFIDGAHLVVIENFDGTTDDYEIVLENNFVEDINIELGADPLDYEWVINLKQGEVNDLSEGKTKSLWRFANRIQHNEKTQSKRGVQS